MHAPECRELVQCLTLQDPACRAAMEWLSSLAVVGWITPWQQWRLSWLTLQAAVGAELAQAAAPGPDVVAVLQREPQAGTTGAVGSA